MGVSVCLHPDNGHPDLSYCNVITPLFQMEEEEHTDRKQQLAMLYQKLNKIKKYLNEGNDMPRSPVTMTSICTSVFNMSTSS